MELLFIELPENLNQFFSSMMGFLWLLGLIIFVFRFLYQKNYYEIQEQAQGINISYYSALPFMGQVLQSLVYGFFGFVFTILIIIFTNGTGAHNGWALIAFAGTLICFTLGLFPLFSIQRIEIFPNQIIIKQFPAIFNRVKVLSLDTPYNLFVQYSGQTIQGKSYKTRKITHFYDIILANSQGKFTLFRGIDNNQVKEILSKTESIVQKQSKSNIYFDPRIAIEKKPSHLSIILKPLSAVSSTAIIMYIICAVLLLFYILGISAMTPDNLAFFVFFNLFALLILIAVILNLKTLLFSKRVLEISPIKIKYEIVPASMLPAFLNYEKAIEKKLPDTITIIKVTPLKRYVQNSKSSTFLHGLVFSLSDGDNFEVIISNADENITYALAKCVNQELGLA